MSFEFTAFREPFPEWHGPYSPARGTTSGFRVRGGRLTTVVDTDDGREEWVADQSSGIQALQHLVVRNWRGGRVLLLPNGLIVKPSPQGDGECWVIGRFRGPLLLRRPDGNRFDFENPGPLRPGDLWLGPNKTGIECVIDSETGSLRAEIRVPTSTGCLRAPHVMVESDGRLARGFSTARPRDSRGRVRVTANGHVITVRHCNGRDECVYVGKIDVSAWAHLAEWAEGVVVERPHRFEVDRIFGAIDDVDAIDEFEQGLREAESFHGESDWKNGNHEAPDLEVEDDVAEEWDDDESE